MQRANELAVQMKKYDATVFLTNAAVEALSKSYENIRMDIEQVCRVCQLNDEGEHMILVHSLTALLPLTEVSNQTHAHGGEINGDNNSFENIDNELENIVHHILLSMQNIYKKYSVEQENLYEAPVTEKNDEVDSKANEPIEIGNGEDEEDDAAVELIQENHLKTKITKEMQTDLATLNASTILPKISKIVTVIRYSRDGIDDSQRSACANKLISIMPILEQYELLCKYYLIQQFGAHKISTKMLSVMLTVFIELGAKGFCIPPDLMQDEDGEKNENEDGKEGEGFGMEDGTGENDVSDK